MANLNEFGPSLQSTREWIDGAMREMGMDDEAEACRVLRGTLQELRNHLTVNEAADLGAQLPLLLRGLFYEGWRPAQVPTRDRTRVSFVTNVEKHLLSSSPGTAEQLVRGVLRFLASRVSKGEIRDVVNSLPRELRELWPEDEQRNLGRVG